MRGSAALLALLLAGCPRAGTAPPAADPIAITGEAPEADEPTREAILAASDLPELLPKPLADDPLGVTVHRLENGMTVYIATDRQEPSFYGWVVVRAGSRHDPADSTGLAHYLEHMLLFKGSDDFGTTDHASEAPHLEKIRELYRELAKAKGDAARNKVLAQIDTETQQVAKYAIPNEIGRLYTGLGFREMNAFTNKDRTYYVQKVPANRVEAWATVEAERFANPVFRLFFPELEAVYEEKNRGLDSSWRRLWQLTGEGLYPEHPLGTQTTIGEVEHLKTPAFDEMIAFHRRWYVPNNMALVLVGDIDDSVLPLLEKKFSRLQPRALEEPPPGKLTAPTGRVVKELLAKDEELTRVGWRTVPAGHGDAAVIEVIDRLLDDDRTGLINVELEQPKKVQWATANVTRFREGGHLTIDAARREGQTVEEVETLIRKTVAKLAQVTDAQVEAAKLHVDIERKLASEFPQATTGRIVDAFVRHRQWTDVVEQDARLRSVTRKDVVAAAKKYLGKGSVVVFRRKGQPDLPKVTKPKITPLDLDATRQSKFAQRVAEIPATPLSPSWVVAGEHYATRRVPAGRMIVSRNTRNDVFIVAYSWNLGYQRSRLLCAAMNAHRESGTQGRTATELQARLYALGSTIQTQCWDDGSQVVVRGIEANLEPTLVLLDEWFLRPKITPETLKQSVEATIERRKTDTEDEDRPTTALRQFAMHLNKSFYLTRPSTAALRSLTPQKATKLVQGLFGHQHRTLYAGTRGIDEAAKILPRGTKHKQVGPPPPRRFRKLRATQIFFLHREQAKANVRISLASAPAKPLELPQHELLSRYVGGGTGSITFREIRTKRSLAYAVGARVDSGRPGDQVEYRGGMQNQSDKVAEAVPALLEVLRRTEIEAGRFAESRSALDEQYRSSRVNPRLVAFEVDEWYEHGYEGDPRPARYKALENVTAEALSSTIKTLAASPAIITIVGDENGIDLDALGKLGKIVKIDPKQLFTP